MSYRHNNGYIMKGGTRIAREDFDTNPTKEYKDAEFDYICEAANNYRQVLADLHKIKKALQASEDPFYDGMKILNKYNTEVVNINNEDYDVYIGRGSKWGNPYIIGVSGTRKECIEQYKKYLLARPDLLEDLPELVGKRLGCHCKPMNCHGDILLELLND